MTTLDDDGSFTNSSDRSSSKKNNTTTLTESSSKRRTPRIVTSRTGDGNHKSASFPECVANAFSNAFSSCFKCVKVSGLLAYVACPPVPSIVVSKFAFHPPLRGSSYRLLVHNSEGEKYFAPSAKAAMMYPRVQVEALPLGEATETDLSLFRARNPAFDAVIVQSRSSNYIVAAYFPVTHKVDKLRTKRRTVGLFCQPNSTDLGYLMDTDCVASFPNMANTLGIDIYSFDYSGYGLSTGSCREDNMYRDASSVYDTIRRREGPSANIVIIGYSIGTTAAVDLASKNPAQLRAVVLIAPFTSGLRLFTNEPTRKETNCLDCFTSIDKIEGVDVPILFCHGTNDEVIPASHTYALHSKARLGPDPVWIPRGGHAGVLNDPSYKMLHEIRNFFRSLRL